MCSANWEMIASQTPTDGSLTMLLLHILRSHQLLVPDFDLLSVVMWGAQISSQSVIFVAIVAGGTYGGAPAVWLRCLKEQVKTVGRKWLERGERGAIGKCYRVQVTVDYAHCKEKAMRGTEDMVQTCWLASIVSFVSSHAGLGFTHIVLTSKVLAVFSKT